MKIKLKEHEHHFKNHVATLRDFGDVKIIDYRNPKTSEYAIRFLFEEDACTLHITGDLGFLTAVSYNNMRFGVDFFEQFVDNPDYFRGKVVCHNRPFETYSETAARKEIRDQYEREQITSALVNLGWLDYDDANDDFWYEEAFDKIFEDYEEHGAGKNMYSFFEEMDASETAWMTGRCDTGIIDLYLFAFKLAEKDLNRQGITV